MLCICCEIHLNSTATIGVLYAVVQTHRDTQYKSQSQSSCKHGLLFVVISPTTMPSCFTQSLVDSSSFGRLLGFAEGQHCDLQSCYHLSMNVMTVQGKTAKSDCSNRLLLQDGTTDCCNRQAEQTDMTDCLNSFLRQIAHTDWPSDCNCTGT